MNTSASCETPPSYDDAVYSSVQGGSSNSNLPNMANADLLCRIDAGVQIYFITPEGYVSAPSYPSCLSIYLLTDHPNQAASASSCETVPAFLQVGDWIYPLLPGQSPVLQSNLGSYIFPDVSSSVPGNAHVSVFFSAPVIYVTMYHMSQTNVDLVFFYNLKQLEQNFLRSMKSK